MIQSKKLFLELIGLSLVMLLLCLLVTYLSFSEKKLPEVICGYFASLVIFCSGFISINWALKKSIKTFMIVVLGGMVLRFILIGLVLFLLMRFTNLNIMFFISSFFIFYLTYQFFEIRFINANLSKGRRWLKFSRQDS